MCSRLAGRLDHVTVNSCNLTTTHLEALGITPTPAQLEVQAKFIGGDMPLAEMLEHVELYVASIDLRWPS